MKTAVIFVALFVALATAADDENCPLAKALKKTFESCVAELEPSDEIMELVATSKGSDNVEVQCFYACMLNKAGLLEKGKTNIDKMEELMKAAEKPDEAKINEVIGGMRSCREEAEVSDDNCVVVANYGKCMKAKNIE